MKVVSNSRFEVERADWYSQQARHNFVTTNALTALENDLAEEGLVLSDSQRDALMLASESVVAW